MVIILPLEGESAGGLRGQLQSCLVTYEGLVEAQKGLSQGFSKSETCSIGAEVVLLECTKKKERKINWDKKVL